MNRAVRPEPHAEPRARRARGIARSIALAAVAAWALAACAPAPNTLELGATRPVRELASAALLRDALAARAEAAEPPASMAEPAFAVVATNDELIAARLDRSTKDARTWRSPLVEGAAQPVLTRGLVVVGSERSVRGLDPSDGRPLWRLPADHRVLLAAAADAGQLALLQVDRRARRSIAVYALGAKGAPRERLRVTARGALGTPALLDGTLLVPWGEGHLSMLDVGRGAELGRARLGDGLLHATWWDGALFFGGPPWVELTAGGAPPYALPRRPLPGVVMGPLPDAAVSSSPAATAAMGPALGADVTRLYVQPAGGGSSSAGGHYLVTYGRIAFGLEREQGALAWVLALPGRALAAVAIEGRFIVCDDSGGVRVLSGATGRVERFWQVARQRRVRLGEPALGACALAPGSVLAASPEGAEPEPAPLLDQLARVLALSDPGLSDAQRFLSRELAARPEPEATQVLIELVRRNSLDRMLQSEAEDLLATRRNGEDHMLAALSESGPRGEGTLPPIAPLGEALAALDERRAAPLIARQLNHPAHTASAIARAAAALERLASEAEYDELSVFFSLHRTTADSAEWVAAVLSVARTLLRVGGDRARTLIQFALRDPLTIAEIESELKSQVGSVENGAVENSQVEREPGTSPQADLAN